MMKRLVRTAAALVMLSACTSAPTGAEHVGASSAPITGCRSTCFALDRLSCSAVERTCGRNHGVLVLDGLPFNCTEAEPMACHYREGTLDACLAQCGGEDDPGNAGEGLAQHPQPDPFGPGGQDPGTDSSGESSGGDPWPDP